jgi:hypothetical protein
MSREYGLTPRLDRKIDQAITATVRQVTAAGGIEESDRVEFAYLIVREKLDRLQEDSEAALTGALLTDEEVLAAVIAELASRMGAHPTARLTYPDNLTELAKNGLTLLA